MLIMIIYILKSCFTVVTSNNHADTYTTFGHDFFVASRAILGGRTGRLPHCSRPVHAYFAHDLRTSRIGTTSLRNSNAVVSTWARHNNQFLVILDISCRRDDMLNVKDTIIAGREDAYTWQLF